MAPSTIHSTPPPTVASPNPSMAPSTTHSTPPPTVASPNPSKELEYYHPGLTITPALRATFESHSIIDALIKSHMERMQEKLWSIYPYPCIGRFEFLNFKLPAYPAYPRILKLLRAGGTFLDAGCGIGQDLRFLKREGIPSSQLFGFDLLQEFIDVGYEVFMDTPEATGIRIQAADVFDEDSWVVREMAGKCAVVNLGYFLHLFSYEKQVKAAVMLARALKGSGGVLVGLHVQSWESSQFSHPIGGEAVWRHDGESFMKMWEEVGREVGCEFEVEVEEGVPFKRIEVDGKMWKKTGYVYQARFTATIV